MNVSTHKEIIEKAGKELSEIDPATAEKLKGFLESDLNTEILSPNLADEVSNDLLKTELEKKDEN